MLSFLELIKSLPEILATLVELKKMWEAYLNVEKRREAMQMFGDAINVARTQKNTSQLTDLVNKIISGQPLK